MLQSRVGVMVPHRPCIMSGIFRITSGMGFDFGDITVFKGALKCFSGRLQVASAWTSSVEPAIYRSSFLGYLSVLFLPSRQEDSRGDGITMPAVPREQPAFLFYIWVIQNCHYQLLMVKTLF